jgi:hypothetical protein
MADLPFQSAVRLAAAIRDRRIGCRELLELYLNRIDRFNPAVNAVVVTDLPAARERADAADRALARGEVWGPLHGVPVTVKEALSSVATGCRRPRIVMVRLDRAISPNTPVKTSLGKPMVRSSRTMTCFQRLPFQRSI